MSGMSLAMAACLAGQTDWRRLTVGHIFSSPSDFYGFSVPAAGNYGAISAPYNSWKGQTVKELYNATNSGAGAGSIQLIISGTFLQTDLSALMLKAGNGQDRYFASSAASAFANTTDVRYGGAITIWVWSPLPANYVWSTGDTGNTRAFGLS